MVLACMSIAVQAQTDKVSFKTNIVTGMPLPDSDIKPLSLLISAVYQIHPRLSAGVGTGLSKYDHLMIPVYGILHWNFTKQHRFTPFLASNIGYAYAPKKHVNGGFYLTPSVGVSYQMKGPQSTEQRPPSEFASKKTSRDGRRRSSCLLLSIGYELQEYTQLKSYESTFALTQYMEDISNQALVVNIGFVF